MSKTLQMAFKLLNYNQLLANFDREYALAYYGHKRVKDIFHMDNGAKNEQFFAPNWSF